MFDIELIVYNKCCYTFKPIKIVYLQETNDE